MTKKERFAALPAALTLVGVIWGIHIVGWVIPFRSFGIFPRDLSSIYTIFTAPFIHAHIHHIIANTTGLLFLSLMLFALEKSKGWMTLIVLIIGAGAGTWLIGRGGAVHLGASGVIYALIGYLGFLGLFQKKIKTIVLSVLILFLYGGAIWGVLPSAPHISWEGHLSGFIAGVVLAKVNS